MELQGKRVLLTGASGGLGEPIATGLALADTRLILFGAIPAAILALVVDGVLGYVERRTTPAPLREAARRASTALTP